MTIAPISRRAALRTSELDELTIGKRGGMTRPLALTRKWPLADLEAVICRHARPDRDGALRIRSFRNSAPDNRGVCGWLPPCPLLMLWTAPPPAHQCHGCGCC